MILLWTISRLQIAIWIGQSTNVREGNNYKTHNSTQLTSKLSRMGCLLSWSWYGYAIQLGQLERLRFCLSKFCIPGLGEFLACEESLSPSKDGGSPSNVSESEMICDTQDDLHIKLRLSNCTRSYCFLSRDQLKEIPGITYWYIKQLGHCLWGSGNLQIKDWVFI